VGAIKIGCWSAKITDGAFEIIHLRDPPALITDGFLTARDDSGTLVPGNGTERTITGTAPNDGH
jgi:hypothetical protein